MATPAGKSIDPKLPPTLTKEEFHNNIHIAIGTPKKKRIKVGHGKSARIQTTSKEHLCNWAETKVNLKKKSIDITVYIDFHKDNLTPKEFSKIKMLATMGIGEYWSQRINISSLQYSVQINIKDRKNNSIEVDLKIHKGSDYKRSHNSGIIDASFIYNQGSFPSNTGLADNNFKLTSAHEFGHSVLSYFGGVGLSWGHKGSTNPVLQSIKASTPGYPMTGDIDLMKYYDILKNTKNIPNIYQRTRATEQDVKRLIWMSNVTFSS